MLLPVATVIACALCLLPGRSATNMVWPGSARALLSGPDLHFPDGVPTEVTLTPPWSNAAPDWTGTPVVTCRACRVPWPPENSSAIEEVQGGMRITTWIRSGGGGASGPETGSIELLEVLDSARVFVRSDTAERECVRAFGRFRCGPEDWIWVGPSTVRMQNRDETCIWMHPTAEGTLVLNWDSLPRMGVVRGRAGVSDQAAETGREAIISLAVALDGSAALQEEFRFERGMQSWRLDVPDGAPTMQLRLEVSANDTGMAHFCLSGTLAGRPTPAGEELHSPRPAPARSERALRRAWGNRFRTFLFGEFARANRPPRARPRDVEAPGLRLELPATDVEGSAAGEGP